MHIYFNNVLIILIIFVIFTTLLLVYSYYWYLSFYIKVLANTLYTCASVSVSTYSNIQYFKM